MEDCGGVHIHFPSEGSGSDKVTIRGPAGEVEKAKKQLLQLAEEKVGKKKGLKIGHYGVNKDEDENKRYLKEKGKQRAII